MGGKRPWSDQDEDYLPESGSGSESESESGSESGSESESESGSEFESESGEVFMCQRQEEFSFRVKGLMQYEALRLEDIRAGNRFLFRSIDQQLPFESICKVACPELVEPLFEKLCDRYNESYNEIKREGCCRGLSPQTYALRLYCMLLSDRVGPLIEDEHARVFSPLPPDLVPPQSIGVKVKGVLDRTGILEQDAELLLRWVLGGAVTVLMIWRNTLNIDDTWSALFEPKAQLKGSGATGPPRWLGVALGSQPNDGERKLTLRVNNFDIRVRWIICENKACSELINELEENEQVGRFLGSGVTLAYRSKGGALVKVPSELEVGTLPYRMYYLTSEPDVRLEDLFVLIDDQEVKVADLGTFEFQVGKYSVRCNNLQKAGEQHFTCTHRSIKARVTRHATNIEKQIMKCKRLHHNQSSGKVAVVRKQ